MTTDIYLICKQNGGPVIGIMENRPLAVTVMNKGEAAVETQ